MTESELDNYLDLIFQKEITTKINSRETWKHVLASGKNIIKYDHADTLINLYQNLESKELKEYCLNKLKYDVGYGGESSNSDPMGNNIFYCSSSALSLFVLVKMGFVDESIEALNDRRGRTAGNILELLQDLLLEDVGNFNIHQLKKISDATKKVELQKYDRNLRHNVLTYLSDNAYVLINKEIGRVNIEINRDKESLLNIIRYLNFDEKYDQFLSQIDQYINTADSIVASGMVGNFRSFIEDILKDIAKRISSKLNESIPKDPEKGEMGNIRAFLKIKLELTDADNSLINKYIDILHAEGGHSFISNIEYFRLSKNIGIEILLLLLSKFKKIFS